MVHTSNGTSISHFFLCFFYSGVWSIHNQKRNLFISFNHWLAQNYLFSTGFILVYPNYLMQTCSYFPLCDPLSLFPMQCSSGAVLLLQRVSSPNFVLSFTPSQPIFSEYDLTNQSRGHIKCLFTSLASLYYWQRYHSWNIPGLTFLFSCSPLPTGT